MQGCAPRWGHYEEALLGDGPEGAEGACDSSMVYDAHLMLRQTYVADLLMTCLVVAVMVLGMTMIVSNMQRFLLSPLERMAKILLEV